MKQNLKSAAGSVAFILLFGVSSFAGSTVFDTCIHSEKKQQVECENELITDAYAISNELFKLQIDDSCLLHPSVCQEHLKEMSQKAEATSIQLSQMAQSDYIPVDSSMKSQATFEIGKIQERLDDLNNKNRDQYSNQ